MAYTWRGMVQIHKSAAIVRYIDEGKEVYGLREDGSEALIESRADFKRFNYFGYERASA